MKRINWQEAPERELRQEEAGLKARVLRLDNGSREDLTRSTEQLLAVLAGECDVLRDGGRYRLRAGGWMELPAGQEAAAHVFRSCGPCVLLQAVSPERGDAFAVCNLLDQPPMDGAVPFGLECRGIHGCLAPQAPEDAAFVLPVRWDGETRQLCLLAGPGDGEAYPAWLKKTCGILWERGVERR